MAKKRSCLCLSQRETRTRTVHSCAVLFPLALFFSCGMSLSKSSCSSRSVPSCFVFHAPPVNPHVLPCMQCASTEPPAVFCLFFNVQNIAVSLPEQLPIFELLVLVTDEFPQLCVGVRDCANGKTPSSQQLKFDIVELNGTPNSTPGMSWATALSFLLIDLCSESDDRMFQVEKGFPIK